MLERVSENSETIPPWKDPRVQRGMEALLKLRRERLAAGDQPLGWKVAFGAPAFREKLQISAPLVGFLTREAALPSGAVVSFADWMKPIAEPEIAVQMAHDLPGGSEIDAIKAAIAGLAPAIELIDQRRPPDDVEVILAGNISNRHVVLGPMDSTRAGANVEGLRGRVFRRGAEHASTNDVQANTGELVTLIRYVADYLAAFGERLRAGDIVICGSIVPPIVLEPDETEFAYELAPVGEVSVRLT